MSNLDTAPTLTRTGGLAEVSPRPAHELFAGRAVALGESTIVRRLLPNLGRRMVGPWCFIDHYGPDDIARQPGMQVPSHPHMGLQTVSWLLDGQVRHRDSLGSDDVIGPGELGLMTAGAAIAHAEHSPAPHPAQLHGAQLWVALPDASRNVEASWERHRTLPTVTDRGLEATVIMGELDGATSPGRSYWPIIGADLALDGSADVLLPLEHEFEHGLLVASGAARIDGQELSPGMLLYAGCGRSELRIEADHPARLLLLGGEPFPEEIVMWWNFVARTGAEIAAAREQWQAGERFGTVTGAGDPLPAPALPVLPLRPGGAERRRPPSR